MKYVILVSGKIHSGKTKFCEYLKKELKNRNLQFQIEKFAGPLKDWCKQDFKPVADYLNNYVESIKTNIKVFEDVGRNPQRDAFVKNIDNMLDQLKIYDDNWYENKTELTRLILQLTGTEIYRKRVDENWWANLMKERILQSENSIFLNDDLRFSSESEVIQSLPQDEYKVITIRVERKVNTKKNIAIHESETALDDYDCWDYVVDNNGTLETLKESVKTIIDDIGLSND